MQPPKTVSFLVSKKVTMSGFFIFCYLSYLSRQAYAMIKKENGNPAAI